MKICIFGLAITSSWGNGHATTFRALCSALHRRGHDIVFYERDVEWYSSNRDLPEPAYCDVRLYDDWNAIVPDVRSTLAEADLAIAGSYFPDGVQAIDEMLCSNVAIKSFYDIDTPITLSQLREHGRTDYLTATQIPGLDLYLSFTGGPTLRELETSFGARHAVPLYCSFDPEKYRRLPVNPRFQCALSYMGTYAPDRQPKVETLLMIPARSFPEEKFIVAGPMYPKDVRWPANVRQIFHLEPKYHAALYSASRLILNVTRRDMVMAGYSPSVRLFEAAACGAAIITDDWPGLDQFFTPGREVLVPMGSSDVVQYLRELGPDDLRKIGEAAQQRVHSKHSNEHRAIEFENYISSVGRVAPAV
jgi:spore maturation protein CgeB